MNDGKAEYQGHKSGNRILQPLDRFIAEARDQQPYEHVIWESVVWDITAANVKTRAHLDSKKRLIFAQHSGARVTVDERVKFEVGFADLVKACLVKRRVSRGMESGTQMVFLRAARYVYDALPLPIRRDPRLINRGHFVSAESAIILRELESSAYRAAQHLDEFGRMLDRHGLCRAKIDFRSSVRKPNDADRTSSTFEERVKGLPTAEVLNALAAISNDADIEQHPFDLLRARLAELLLVAGFRIGEVLTLPADTLVREYVLDESLAIRRDAITSAPIERLGLRYWPEKGGDPVVKWIPTVANPLVLRAIENIERLCRPARENAAWLDANPDDVKVDVGDSEHLSYERVAHIIGIRGADKVLQWFNERKRGGRKVILGVTNRRYVTGAALRRALASDRFDKPVITRADGKVQLLGESLFAMYLYDWSENRPTNRYISMPVSWQHVKDFLCGRDGMPSVFERRGQLDDAGQPYRMKSHDFRRLLNIIAQRGGLSQTEIAQWMGRRRVADNAVYDLRTASEMAAEMRQLVSSNEVYGVIADQVQQMPEAERGPFLDARLAMIHTTPHGQCASNIVESPCATAVSCLGGCRQYLRRKGDAKSRESLIRIERETLIDLQQAREAMAAGKYKRGKLATESGDSAQDGTSRPGHR